METVLITGGTGLIGSSVAKFLIEKGYSVAILTRNKSLASDNPLLQYVWWNIKEGKIEGDHLSDINYIINLAGAGVVEKKWTKAYKEVIQQSRIESGKLITHFLASKPHQIKAVVSASAIGWYGPDSAMNNSGFSEDFPADKSFLGSTCQLWEESVQSTDSLGVRLVILRIGIVLSNAGGALKEFKKPLSFGIAPIFGSGKQMTSWIHIDDLCRMMLFAIENEKVRGVYNAVAPDPVSNKNFMMKLAKIMRGFFYLPVYVPAILLKLMMGERSIELLKSATVLSNKIINSGFEFQFPTIESAFEQLNKKY